MSGGLARRDGFASLARGRPERYLGFHPRPWPGRLVSPGPTCLYTRQSLTARWLRNYETTSEAVRRLARAAAVCAGGIAASYLHFGVNSQFWRQRRRRKQHPG